MTKDLKEILVDTPYTASPEWHCKVVINDQCLSYVVWNTNTSETLIVDPKLEDSDVIKKIVADIPKHRIIAVVDSHTHADHVSCAAALAEFFKVPYLMSTHALTKKATLRVSQNTLLSTAAGPLRLLMTPGHTNDSVTVMWGPYLFGGDTLLFGDTGRDDLPTGDAEAHFESLELIKKHVTPDTLILPGHDFKGGRASSWAVQLKANASLTQSREQFVPEASGYKAAAPTHLKEALFENFK